MAFVGKTGRLGSSTAFVYAGPRGFGRCCEYHNMCIFSAIIDKRSLHSYMDESRIHRKAWELILEQVQCFMWIKHPRHQASLITDNLSRQDNRKLAMKHAYLLETGTTNRIPLRKIVEMPLFVRSEDSVKKFVSMNLAFLSQHQIDKSTEPSLLQFFVLKSEY